MKPFHLRKKILKNRTMQWPRHEPKALTRIPLCKNSNHNAGNPKHRRLRQYSLRFLCGKGGKETLGWVRHWCWNPVDLEDWNHIFHEQTKNRHCWIPMPSNWIMPRKRICNAKYLIYYGLNVFLIFVLVWCLLLLLLFCVLLWLQLEWCGQYRQGACFFASFCVAIVGFASVR